MNGVEVLLDLVDLGPVECIESRSIDTTTEGFEDLMLPAGGEVFIYLVEFYDGWHSSYGTETAQSPRVVSDKNCR